MRTRYGPPDVVRIEEVPAPTPRPDELLVRVHATTVNRTDRPLIDRHYPLDRIVEAYEYVESGRKLGNVVIDVP